MRRRPKLKAWDRDGGAGRPEKTKTRDDFAQAISRRFTAPHVFSVVAQNVHDLRVIDRLVPDAVFYGTNQYSHQIDNIHAINDAGKRAHVQYCTVAAYISKNAGLLSFDAAFLDYNGLYLTFRSEIREFASLMLKPSAVLAITTQRGDIPPEMLKGMIVNDLAVVAKTVEVEFYNVYQSTRSKSSQMINIGLYLVRNP